MKFRQIIGIGMLLALGGTRAHAAPVTYQLSGEIIGRFDGFGAFVTSIQMGDPWMATFTIDSDEPNTITCQCDPNTLQLAYYGNLSGTISVGSGLVITFGPTALLQVMTNSSLRFDQGTGPTSSNAIDGGIVNTATIFLEGPAPPDKTIESTLGLPLEVFTGNRYLDFRVVRPNGLFNSFAGSITSYSATLAPVPLPGAVWLLSGALLVLTGLRRWISVPR